jgi:hypothetical protein
MVVVPDRRPVALLGAGTQGRRLAYMVRNRNVTRFLWSESANSLIQWSSQGEAVHLIDAQSEQLQNAVAFIENLRSESQGQSCSCGDIKTFTSDRIADALDNVWLIVEVY